MGGPNCAARGTVIARQGGRQYTREREKKTEAEKGILRNVAFTAEVVEVPEQGRANCARQRWVQRLDGVGETMQNLLHALRGFAVSFEGLRTRERTASVFPPQNPIELATTRSPTRPSASLARAFHSARLCWRSKPVHPSIPLLASALRVGNKVHGLLTFASSTSAWCLAVITASS